MEINLTPEAVDAPDPATVDVWVDVVCPWCCIGEARLEQAIADLRLEDQVTVRVRSFQLDPDAKRGPLFERLGAKSGLDPDGVRKMVEPMVALGEELGIAFDFEHAIASPSLDAHRLLQLAGACGRDPELIALLHRAHFTDGEDISDHEVLRRLGLEAGLDDAKIETVLTTDAFRAEVEADQRQAHSYGVGGVPFFIFNGRLAISGAQPVQLIARALTRAREGDGAT